jgi:hypothetical protein
MKICHQLHLLAPLLLVTASLTGCISITDYRTVHGSGNVLTEARPVSGFDQISVSGAGELTLTQGDEETLTIEAEDNLLPFIRSEVSLGHLFIGPHNVNFHATKPIHYRIGLKNLNALHLSGAVRAEADAIRTEHLALRISGAGGVNVAHLETGTLSAHISGAGHISAAGQANSQAIHISGAGKHHAPDLRCSRAEAHISGAGHALLWVVDSLSAHISGSGGVEYRGHPSIDSHISGAGHVRYIGGAE